ncbi:hypothetical protein [Reyranella sp.]|uniref:hypothetical protein n=1 Tax=Reyranella sp. TaxID=1929291 RepID=UPI003D0D9900
MTVQLIEAGNSGELDPLLLGRRSLPSYATGLRRGLNCIALPHGPTVRRPGNRRAGTAASSTRWTASFVFGVGDAYTIEFLDRKLRFWRSDGSRVMDGPMSPLEVSTPWTASQARALRWVRSGDVMWFVHPDFPMQELKRTALAPAEAFTLAEADEKDGPYFSENSTEAFVTLSGTGTGDLVVTCSRNIFDDSSPSKDIGRHFRVKRGHADNQSWAWGTIKSVADRKHATVTFVTEVISATQTAAWRLGLFSKRTGYASSIAIFQERLARGSNVRGSFPRVDLSKSGNFLTSSPGTDDDFGIQAVIAITVDDNGVPVIRDLRPSIGALLVATGAGILRIAASGSTTTLTPLNVDVGPVLGSTGCGTVPTIGARGSMLYLDLQGRSLGEIRPTSAVYPDSLGYREISIRNGHLLRQSPIVSMAWADKPWGLIIMARADGGLVFGTYAPDQEVVNFTPGRLAADGRVECVNVLPTADGNEPWMLVERGGVRGLEVQTNLLREDQPDRLAVNLDSAISSKVAPSATLTRTGPDTWQASAAVFVAGDAGRAIRVLEPGEPDALNMPTWLARTLRILTVPAANTVTVTVESAAAPASPVASGEWLLSRTTIEGLDTLDGQSVLVLGDGAELGPYTVAAGAVTTEVELFYATAGLAYRSEVQPMPPNPQTRKGSALGRPVSGQNRATVVRSGGLKQAREFGVLSGLRPLRHGTQPMGVAPPFYTGDLELEPLPASDTPVGPLLVADGAYPFCIAALAPDYTVGELG